MSDVYVDASKQLYVICQAPVLSVCFQCLRRAVTVARDNRIEVLSSGLLKQRRLRLVNYWTNREAPDLHRRDLESRTGLGGLDEMSASWLEQNEGLREMLAACSMAIIALEPLEQQSVE